MNLIKRFVSFCKQDIQEHGGYHAPDRFIIEQRQSGIDSLKYYLQNYRRGIFVVIGHRGSGKTRLVREVFKKQLFRIVPHREQKIRQVLPVWVDLSSLGIPSALTLSCPQEGESAIKKNNNEPQSKENEIPSPCPAPQLEVAPLKFSDQDFLQAILLALSENLAAHSSFRRKGKGLRTKLKFKNYYFGVPLFVRELGTRLCTSSEFSSEFVKSFFSAYQIPLTLTAIWETIRRYYFIIICLSMPILIKLLVWVVGLYFFSFPEAALQTTVTITGKYQAIYHWLTLRYHTLANITIIEWYIYFICITPLAVFLIRRIELWILQRRTMEIRRLGLAREYKLRENEKLELIAKPSGKWFNFGSWRGNRHEEVVYERDVPYLLNRLKEYLFFLHRLGIEPVLVIDEVDKLGIERDIQQRFMKIKPGVDNQHLKYPEDFQGGTINHELLIFWDRVMRFKESVFQHLPTILLANSDLAVLLDESRRNNYAYHTFVKETLFVGPVGPDAVAQLIRKLYKPAHRDCIVRKPRPDTQEPSSSPCNYGDALCGAEECPKDVEEQTGTSPCEDCRDCTCDCNCNCTHINAIAVYCCFQTQGNYSAIMEMLHTFKQHHWKIGSFDSFDQADIRYAVNVNNRINQLTKAESYQKVKLFRKHIGSLDEFNDINVLLWSLGILLNRKKLQLVEEAEEGTERTRLQIKGARRINQLLSVLCHDFSDEKSPEQRTEILVKMSEGIIFERPYS